MERSAKPVDVHTGSHHGRTPCSRRNRSRDTRPNLPLFVPVGSPSSGLILVALGIVSIRERSHPVVRPVAASSEHDALRTGRARHRRQLSVRRGSDQRRSGCTYLVGRTREAIRPGYISVDQSAASELEYSSSMLNQALLGISGIATLLIVLVRVGLLAYLRLNS